MVGTLIKQPNGKYCIVNYSGDVTHYNLTEQDIINMYIEDAKASIEASKHYGQIIKETIGYNNSLNRIPDEILKDMGFDKTYDELIKFIPREPIKKYYAPCDFTTYGKCPNCGETVEDCMGRKDEKCRHCDQLLKW